MSYIGDYGRRWTEQEDGQLNILYNTDMLDIIEISKKIPNRSPYTIVKRLLKKKNVESFESARGYNVWIKTPEYRIYMDYVYDGLGCGRAYSN